MKAVRSLELNVTSLWLKGFNELTDDEVRERLTHIDDQRLFVMAEAIRRGISVDEIHAVTKVDLWFLDRITEIVDMENALQTQVLDRDLLLAAKKMCFTDGYIARLSGHTHKQIKALRNEMNIHAVFKMVDTCAAEFEARTPLLLLRAGGPLRRARQARRGPARRS